MKTFLLRRRHKLALKLRWWFKEQRVSQAKYQRYPWYLTELLPKIGILSGEEEVLGVVFSNDILEAACGTLSLLVIASGDWEKASGLKRSRVVIAKAFEFCKDASCEKELGGGGEESGEIGKGDGVEMKMMDKGSVAENLERRSEIEAGREEPHALPVPFLFLHLHISLFSKHRNPATLNPKNPILDK